jgi:hypothetical protein
LISTGFDEAGLDMKIPVILDAYKKEGLSRYIYYSLEFDTPESRWQLNIENDALNVYLQNMSAILYEPVDSQSGRFRHAGDFETLFALIEERYGDDALVVQEEIWFPNLLLETAEKAKRGDMFRVDKKLFNTAYMYQSGKTEADALFLQSEKMKGSFLFSPEETSAYQTWSEKELLEAKNYHRENTKERLQKIDG